MCVPFIPPSEFWEMDDEEVQLAVDGIRNKTPVAELLRINAFVCAQCHSKKRMKIKDFYRFEWDDERKEPEEALSTEEVKERMERFRKAYQNLNE